jgi:DNA-binding MarR family transcriptional regulator
MYTKSGLMTKSNRAEGIDVYIQFLNVALKHAKEAPISQLDADEVALLQAIALKDFAGEPAKVMDAMKFDTLGSPATLHRRLGRLRTLGLVEVRADAFDSRIKYLKVSELVQDYFARMGKALLKAGVVPLKK